MAEETNKPAIKADNNGTYHGIFLAPTNMEQRIPAVLTEMAKTDTELSKAITDGKKTLKGCVRWLRNNMADLARAMKTKEITFNDESVHLMARYYMTNPDCIDAQNVVSKATEGRKKADGTKTKEEPKKTATEPKKSEEKKAKVIPLTPQMGSLFGDDDF